MVCRRRFLSARCVDKITSIMEKLKNLQLYIREKWAELVLYLRRKHKEKLTIMLIPHTEKKILNFHISVLSISIIVFITCILVLFSSLSIIGRSSTIHEVRELKISNANYLKQRQKIRDEVKPLHQLITRFTNLTGQLYANAGGPAFTPEEESEALEAGAGSGNQGQGGPAENEEEAKTADKTDPELSEKDKPKYYLPPEVALLKRDIHNLKQIREWGQKTIDLLKKQKKILTYTPTIWPVKGHIISPFGTHIDRATGREKKNNGLDIGALPGSPVLVTADGKVTNVSWQPDLGYNITVTHQWGFKTKYAHLERVTVRKNQMLKKGDRVGFVGKTGIAPDHMLHYEIWVGLAAIDPYPFLNQLEQ